MKTFYKILGFTFVGALATQVSFAQKDNVGIGTTKPDQSAALDVSSNSKGFLMPRLSLQQRNSIQNPAKGLIVYQTDMLSGFYFYDGDKWQPLASNNTEKSVAADPNDWTMSGSTAPANAVLGTLNNVPLRIVTNNVASGLIETAFATRNTFWGYQAGQNNTVNGIRNVGIGYQAFQGLVGQSGDDNVAIGVSVLARNTTGGGNLGLGTFSLQNNSTGSMNVAIGSSALNFNQTGANNVAIGRQAGNGVSNNAASDNTIIGTQAGFNITGSKNLLIGYQAGFSETGSNMLYLSNSNSANPLIKGNFDTDWLRINVGSATGTANTAATASYVAIGNFDPATPMAIPTGYRLVVEQGILTEKIKVALKSTTVGGDWSDYVFEDSYKLMPLEKVEEFIKENKHLPNVPSAEEMLSNGNDLIKTDAKLLEKIEELTLYMIEMKKEIKALKSENEALRNKK